MSKMHPTDQKDILHSKTPSARALISAKDKILLEWEATCRREMPEAAELQHPILIDTIPMFLDNLGQALAQEHPRVIATSNSDVAQEHGGERARVTRYGPDQIVQEYVFLRRSIFTHLARATPLTDKDLICISNSIDDALRQAIMAYFSVHERIRLQFTATLSHDLRGPIGVAKMGAELINEIAEGAKPDLDVIKDLSKRIMNNSRRADEMIQNLLDASALRAGEKLALRITNCEIMSIIERLIADQNSQDRGRINLEGEPVEGYWDPEALRRAIENLISNAIKYGAIDTPVGVKVTTTHGRLMITVHNEGNPIPAEERESLFQAFRRAESARQSLTKGWGIGLALARSVAEQLGGSLGCDSSVETGTTFNIDIPCDSRPFQKSSVTV